MKTKIDGRKVIKVVGKGLEAAAAVGASKITKDILNKVVEENISKNVFVQIGMYALSGYAGLKASEFIETKVDIAVKLVDGIYEIFEKEEENINIDEEEKEKENETAN